MSGEALFFQLHVPNCRNFYYDTIRSNKSTSHIKSSMRDLMIRLAAMQQGLRNDAIPNKYKKMYLELEAMARGTLNSLSNQSNPSNPSNPSNQSNRSNPSRRTQQQPSNTRRYSPTYYLEIVPPGQQPLRRRGRRPRHIQYIHLGESDSQPRKREEVPLKTVIGTPGDCPVCLQKYSLMVETTCGHRFCKRCMKECLKTFSTCPVCRSSITK